MKLLISLGFGIAAIAVNCMATPGKLDTRFSPAANAFVWAIENAPQGGLYVAGYTLKRLNADGTDDTRFSCPIDITATMFSDMPIVLADSDGSLLVAGNFSIDSQQVFTARVLPTGAIDPAFHHASIGPLVPASIVTSGALDASGRLLLAGPFHFVDGSPVSGFTRLLPNGRRDESFNPPESLGFVNAFGLLPDGRIVVGTEKGVTMLNADGTLDRSTPSYPMADPVSALAVSDSGKIAVANYTVHVLRSDLTDDPSFSSDFSFFLGVTSLTFTPDGDLFASGTWREPAYPNPAVKFGLVRFLPSGAVDPDWFIEGSDASPLVKIVPSSGDLYIGGRFTSIQGVPRPGVARLHGSNSGEIEWKNTSARAAIDGNDPLIVGFVVRGDETVQVLLRAVGPSLSTFGVTAPLQHPELAVYSGSNRVYEASGWSDTTKMRSIQDSVGAFPLSRNSTDTATVVMLSPGAYTLVITAPKGEKGTVLGEVYKVR